MYGRSNARPGVRPNMTTARNPVRGTGNPNPNNGGSMGRSQPIGRGPPSRHEDESPPPLQQPPPQSRNPPRQQKPSGGGSSGQGYGDYDHLYKNAPAGNGQAPAMPKFVLCYVCGRKYGTQSIEIHEPQCLEKWHIENAKLPPHMRRPPPRKPDVNSSSGGNYTLDEINDAAYEASKAQLIPCDICGRKFAADRIQIHQRSCKPGNASRPAPGGRMPQQRAHDENDYDDMPINAPNRSRAAPNSNPAGSGGSSSGNAGLYPCSICRRTFASDRIQQHEAACMKANKQRRVFDSTKQRLEGTEAATFFRKGRGRGRNEPSKPQIPKSNWRQKHQDFIQAIRYAKQASSYEKAGGRLADLPPPPPSLNPDYVQCPHCGRNYAPMVAERHIPKCVNIQNKPRPPPGNARTGPPQRGGASNGRAPVSNYSSSSGGFGNSGGGGGGGGYPPPNRSTRGGRY